MILSKNPRQPSNVVSHWYTVTEGMHFSAVEFYDSIEEELTNRKVPRLRARRVEYHEGSALSDRRLYLRLARERFAFEACAAPFGTDFFFSLRFVEIPRGGWVQLTLLFLAVASAIYGLSQLALYAYYRAGLQFWVILGLLTVLGILFSVRRQRKRNEKWIGAGETKPRVMPDFDAILLSLPVIGEWYEKVRKETYYRYDTRVVFHSLITEIVKKRVEHVTAAHGVKLLRTYDYNPILGELYKSATVTLPDT